MQLSGVARLLCCCTGYLGDELGIANAQTAVGFALRALERLCEAESVLDEALTRARRLDHRRLTALLLREIAKVRVTDGDFDAARRGFAEANAIFRALGAEQAAAVNLAFDLAFLEYRAGHPELALRHATEILPIVRSHSHKQILSLVLINISEFLVALARYDEAGIHGREALEVARERHEATRIVSALRQLAAVAVLRPQDNAASRARERARAALLLGFIEARPAGVASVEVPVQRVYDRLMDTLRAELGHGKLAGHMATGAAMTEDQAIEAALVADV